MKFDTHTHITLTQEDLKQMIIDNLKAQGYRASLQDVDFIVGGDMYESPSLRCCSIIARKEDGVK